MERKISILGLVANLVLGVAKTAIGIMAGSASILAEGLHSGMDVISSGISFVGIKASRKPVDKGHPYGHYKAEVIGGLFITVILFMTALWIILEAVRSFVSPRRPVVNLASLGVMAFSALVNGAMARLKIKSGERYDSLSLVSDGVHSRVDVFTSLAVLSGLFLVRYFVHADALLALLIGLYILKESFVLGRKATDSLLDASAGEDVERKIRTVAEERRISLSGLKTQKRGPVITANLEIELPALLKIDEATDMADGLRKELMKQVENLDYVAIQIKSSNISTGYFKPPLGSGRGFGWRGPGRTGAEASEHAGMCVCPKCGYEVAHERGVPCASRKCPECGTNLTRKM